MKKLVSLVLVLVLSVVFCGAMAASSSGTENYTEATTSVEDVELGFSLIAVNEATLTEEQLVNFETAIEQSGKEIAKLAEQGIEAYFGDFTDVDGNVINAAELLETETLNCNEFCPVFAVCNEMPDVETLDVFMRFLTPYAVGEKVIVNFGIINGVDENNEVTSITWHAYVGEGVEPEADQPETEGRVKVTIDLPMFEQIVNGSALVAIISK